MPVQLLRPSLKFLKPPDLKTPGGFLFLACFLFAIVSIAVCDFLDWV
jgi:hypothetical protein